MSRITDRERDMDARIVTLPTGERLRRIDDGTPGPTLGEGIVDAIDRIAREDPERPAVVTPDGRVSYAELARSSRSLAAAIGVASAAPVLVLGPANRLLVAATVACLRLGRPIVPVDPELSPLRTLQVVMLSGADVLVRDAGDPPPIPELAPDRIRTIPWPLDAGADITTPPPVGDHGFIIFTSGSTGVPKGVAHGRAAIDDAVALENRLVDLRPGDRLALMTPAMTLAGALLTLMPLSVGGTLLLLSERGSPADLMDLMQRERATHLLAYVGLARALAQHPRAPAAFAHMRALQIYGDIIRIDDRDRMQAALPPGAALHLLYGSTEAMALFADVVTPDMAPADGRMPLGRTAPGVELWLRQPADPDHPDEGEICAAGARIAPGYWRDHGGSAGQFGPHPVDPGRRLFRVGDIVRRRPDGLFQFVGRVDNQVKLRGWRIELEDIETAAQQVPGVAVAGVVARRSADGVVEQLVLHLAAAAAPGLVERVEAALAATLPAHMIPARILVSPALPMTATAKVDRVRLAEMDRQLRDAATAMPAGSRWPDALALRIAAVIADEAGLPGLGPDDDLNALGVDSLQAVNVALRIEKQWGVPVEPIDLLDGGPIGGLVATIAAAARAA